MTRNPLQSVDTKELELPDTIFIRDIESSVFQSLVLQSLAHIEGVAPLEGNFFDQIIGRESLAGLRGIHVEQDEKNHSVHVKLEINVMYGVNIPDKAEEVQMKISQDISRLTGLHVSSIHVIVKNLISPKQATENTAN